MKFDLTSITIILCVLCAVLYLADYIRIKLSIKRRNKIEKNIKKGETS